MRLAFRVAYAGGGFSGSQIQPDVRTVEGVFIGACRELDLFSDWREAGFAFAGRTDAGVSARGQVCAFSTDHPGRAVRVINRILPADCWCTGWAEVAAGFHPRYAASRRTYRYYFPAGDLDAAAMEAAAGSFVGTHDFSRFARVGDKNPLRTVIAVQVIREGEFLVFEVTGESFLWNMVRCMATALEAAGRGELPGAGIARLLGEADGDRLPAAPAAGLVFWNADCGITFQEMPIDPRSRAFCTGRIREIELEKKVIGELCRPRLDLGRE
jgi:tRNA pseudouridine38-40 synthase